MLVRSILSYFRKLFRPSDHVPARDSAHDSPQKKTETHVGERTGHPQSRRPRRPRKSHRTDRSSDTSKQARPTSRKYPPADEVASLETPWNIAEYQVPIVEGKTRFHDLDLPLPVMHAIADLGFQYCTPIQAEILPSVLQGKDAKGKAQTGTGKTAAFLIGILTHLVRHPIEGHRKNGTPRALVIAPTRELAIQIEQESVILAKYLRCKSVAVYGGMDYQKQRRKLSERVVDIVIATPGRLIDFKNKRDIDLREVEILVIDEADRMLDMGFIPDTRKIVLSTPHKDKRQTMFFSATFNPDVHRLALSWTRDAVTVEIDPEQVAVDTVEQVIYITTSDEKFTLLYNLMNQQNLSRVIVFGNRRDETRELQRELSSRGINCGLLSGEVSQHERLRTLESLRDGTLRVLVATDVAARGLHISGVSHVINYNLPLDPEDYVHRIGRTGRAGELGISVSFACEDDGTQIPLIEEFIGRKLPCVYPDETLLQQVPPPSVEPSVPKFEEEKDRRNRRRPPRRRNRGPRNN